MGWLSKNDDSDYISSSSGATRKVVTSQCRTEEAEPGKFIRRCEKTEKIFKDCLGRPSEMVQSTKEYTEEDVTDQMVKGSFPLDSEQHGPSYFPGLHSDIEAIERGFFDGISRFFDAAEDMKNEFFNSVGGVPHIFDNNKDSSSSHKRGIPIEGVPPTKSLLESSKLDGDVDLSGLAKDV